MFTVVAIYSRGFRISAVSQEAAFKLYEETSKTHFGLISVYLYDPNGIVVAQATRGQFGETIN